MVYVNKSLLTDRIVNKAVNKKVVNKLRVDTVLLGKAGKMLKRFRMWPAFRPKIAFFIFFNRNTTFKIAKSLVSTMYVALHFYTKVEAQMHFYSFKN